jgi:hypothetical protein
MKHRHETEQWRLGKEPKGVTYIGKVIREVMGSVQSYDTQVRVTMVTGVRHNEQPGELEAGEGAHVTISNFTHIIQILTVSTWSVAASNNNLFRRGRLTCSHITSTEFNMRPSKLYRNVVLNIDRNTIPIGISVFSVDGTTGIIQRYYLCEIQR